METISELLRRDYDIQIVEALKPLSYSPYSIHSKTRELKDPEQLMYDFYVLTYAGTLPSDPTKSDMMGRQLASFVSKRNIGEEIDEAIKKLLPPLKQEMLDAVFFSVCAEIRHIIANPQKQLDKDECGAPQWMVMKEYIRQYAARVGYAGSIFKRENEPTGQGRNSEYDISHNCAIKAIKVTDTMRITFMQACAFMFRNAKWSSSFGGPKWAEIAEAWVDLAEASRKEDVITYIDHVYDLQHNTDTVFNKVSRYSKSGGYGWIKKALDKKASIDNVGKLLDDCSSDARKIAEAAMKMAGVTKEGLKKPEEPNKPEAWLSNAEKTPSSHHIVSLLLLGKKLEKNHGWKFAIEMQNDFSARKYMFHISLVPPGTNFSSVQLVRADIPYSDPEVQEYNGQFQTKTKASHSSDVQLWNMIVAKGKTENFMEIHEYLTKEIDKASGNNAPTPAYVAGDPKSPVQIALNMANNLQKTGWMYTLYVTYGTSTNDCVLTKYITPNYTSKGYAVVSGYIRNLDALPKSERSFVELSIEQKTVIDHPGMVRKLWKYVSPDDMGTVAFQKLQRAHSKHFSPPGAATVKPTNTPVADALGILKPLLDLGWTIEETWKWSGGDGYTMRLHIIDQKSGLAQSIASVNVPIANLPNMSEREAQQFAATGEFREASLASINLAVRYGTLIPDISFLIKKVEYEMAKAAPDKDDLVAQNDPDPVHGLTPTQVTLLKDMYSKVAAHGGDKIAAVISSNGNLFGFVLIYEGSPDIHSVVLATKFISSLFGNDQAAINNFAGETSGSRFKPIRIKVADLIKNPAALIMEYKLTATAINYHLDKHMYQI